MADLRDSNVADADALIDDGDAAGDFILAPDSSVGKSPDISAKMSAVIYDRPHVDFVLPSGDTVFIYSKSEGQLRNIDIALQEWLDTERMGEKKIVKLWRFWRGRRRRVHSALTRIQRAKFAFFSAIFEDNYNPEKHQRLTAAQFLQMPLDLQTQIMTAHREANDPTDLLAAILGRDIAGDGKKKQMPRRDG